MSGEIGEGRLYWETGGKEKKAENNIRRSQRRREGGKERQRQDARRETRAPRPKRTKAVKGCDTEKGLVRGCDDCGQLWG